MPKILKNSTAEFLWKFPNFSPTELYQIRESMGFTISQIQAYTGLHPQTIRRIEAGIPVNKASMNLYQMLMERLYAFKEGYLPAYRKIGESTFKN